MITVIKNINVYVPEKLGKKDVVIVNDKIEGIYDNLNIPNRWQGENIISWIFGLSCSHYWWRRRRWI